MKIPRAYSRVSLAWLLYCQAWLILALWHAESDVPELFGSTAMDRVFCRLGEPIGMGTAVLFALGILLASLYA